MAEALSIAAGSIAVVQITGQVGKIIIQLNNLWREVKNVSPTVKRLMREVEILDPILLDIEKGHMDFPPSYSNDAAVKLCIRYCRNANQAMADLVTSLSHEINSIRRPKSRLGSVKAVLKKDTLARLEQELGSAIRLLMLAQQFYVAALIKLQPDIFISKMALMGLTKDPGSQNASLCKDRGRKQNDEADEGVTNEELKPLISADWSHLPSRWRFGALGFKVSFAWSGKSHRAHICSPNWLSNFAWDLQVFRYYSGWQIYVQSHPVRSNDSPPFIHVKNGNLERLLESFKKGEASPFDEDSTGWSLIHHAALRTHIDICKKLLDMGVNINRRTDSQLTVLRCFTQAACNPFLDPESIEFTRFLLSRGAEYECYDGEPPNQQLTGHYHGTPETFIMMQNHFFPSYYEKSLETRLLCALQIAINPWRSVAEFQVAISRDGKFHTKDIMASLECHISIFHLAVLGLGVRLENSTKAEFLAWHFLVRQVLSQIKDPSVVVQLPALNTSYLTQTCNGQIQLATPLLCIIIGAMKGGGQVCDDWKSLLSKAVRLWIGILQAGGIDLMVYGSAEHAMHVGHFQDNWFHVGRNSWITGVARLNGFRYGLETESWGLLWEERLGEVTGDFWRHKKDPHLNLPGAWIDDYWSESRCTCLGQIQ